MSETKLENFEKALRQLNEMVAYKKSGIKDTFQIKMARDSLIQRFEFTFELAWKSLADFLESHMARLEFKTPRAVIKKAFQMNIIEDEQLWISLLESRNLMAHTYTEEAATEIAEDIIKKFAPEMNELLKKLKKHSEL